MLLQWIEHTLRARGVEVSPSAAKAILDSLRAMAASDDTALTQRTLRAITRIAKKDQQHRDEEDTHASNNKKEEASKAKESSDDKTSS